MLRLLREGEEERLKRGRSSGRRRLRAFAVRLSDLVVPTRMRDGTVAMRSSWSATDVTGDTARAAAEVRLAIIQLRRSLARLRNAMKYYRQLRERRVSLLNSGRIEILARGEDDRTSDSTVASTAD